MATIEPTVRSIEGGAFVAEWLNMAAGDVGAPVKFAGASDRTVHVTGDFDGASVLVQGSLEPTPSEFVSLTDPQGNALSIGVGKVETVMELVRHIRPEVSGGGASTAVNVYILLGGVR